MSKKRVFIIDDQPLAREWLGTLIDQHPGLEMCGDATTIDQAIRRMRSACPDLAVAELALGENSNGELANLELIKRIKEAFPAVVVLVLSMRDETLYAERALKAGAAGYVMKREASEKILEAMQSVLSGKLHVSPAVATLFAERLAGRPNPPGTCVEQLSRRESQVFELLGLGMTTRDIAGRMGVTLGTVQAFCARIKEKLNLKNATELLREAVRWQESRKQP